MTTDDKNIVEIKNLSKLYGKKQALKDINLKISTGMYGLLGRNGAGKTTLMRIIATLLEKNQGEVVINGIQIENKKEIRKIIGYLPQEFSIYPNMTVYGALDYLGLLSELSDEDRKTRINYLLNKVNLMDNKNIKVKNLSGGMKRRLGIAQALLHNPQILIVDEPTAGLDPEERIRFRNLLCEFAKDRIVILSTHIASDIESSCENVSILNEGEILYAGSVEELIEHAKGKVYTIEVPKEETERVKDNYIVLGMQPHKSNVICRVLTDNTSNKALEKYTLEPCEATIEDGYMQILVEKENEL